jgi:hypothetical protein
MVTTSAAPIEQVQPLRQELGTLSPQRIDALWNLAHMVVPDDRSGDC